MNRCKNKEVYVVSGLGEPDNNEAYPLFCGVFSTAQKAADRLIRIWESERAEREAMEDIEYLELDILTDTLLTFHYCDDYVTIEVNKCLIS